MTTQQKIEFLYGMKIVLRNRAKIDRKFFTVFGYTTIFTDTSKYWNSDMPYKKIVLRNRANIDRKFFTVFGYATIFTDTSKYWTSEISIWSDIISALKPVNKPCLSLDTPKVFSKNIQIVINHLKTQSNEPTLH